MAYTSDFILTDINAPFCTVVFKYFNLWHAALFFGHSLLYREKWSLRRSLDSPSYSFIYFVILTVLPKFVSYVHFPLEKKKVINNLPLNFSN